MLRVGPAFEKLIVQGRSGGQVVVGVEAHDDEIPCPTLRNERRFGAFMANLKLWDAKLDACRREPNEAAEAPFNPL